MTVAALDPVQLVSLLLKLPLLLTTDLEHPVFLHLHLLGPGRSALNTCTSGVSCQSTGVPTTVAEEEGRRSPSGASSQNSPSRNKATGAEEEGRRSHSTREQNSPPNMPRRQPQKRMEEAALVQLGHRSCHRRRRRRPRKKKSYRGRKMKKKPYDGRRRRRPRSRWKKKLRKKARAAEEEANARKQFSRMGSSIFSHVIWTDLGPALQKSKLALRPNKA
ncbi:hypothetical protein AXF42_Ash000638 [Apostasia shenzhenica]|uniref:Uncharacterized protein n=1 Tax=Apostasia shenzhenica TaxID=1088818 RepID=A0A2I0AGX1_9ASPA|nr:hypothetical protein AXF42_Ash000638 [Apostasia shenzhenica]